MKIISDEKNLTFKQELFCVKVLEGLNLSDAYRAVYNSQKSKPATVNRAAKELADNPRLAARIALLRQGATAIAIKKAGYTLADAMTEAAEDRQLAIAGGQASAAVAATKLRAQLAGHLIERKETSNKGALDDTDVAVLVAMRDEMIIKLKRLQDEAAAVAGDLPPPPIPTRRVIG